MVEFVGYEHVEPLAEGGLGRLYKATRISTGGTVAIKELREMQFASDVTHRARRELSALLKLKGHPYVVSVEEIIEGPNGPCIVMEYAPGGSLYDRVLQRPLDGPELVLAGQHVVSALSAAHEVGIIHRDVKPHNLLVGSFGQVKVCDFGIAALYLGPSGRTQTQSLTLAYASPEELDGDQEVGPPADVYSFGATWVHLMTGKRPTFKDRMSGSSMDISLPTGAVEPGLRSMLLALRASLAHDPADRPTMDDLRQVFDDSAMALGPRRLHRFADPVVTVSPTPPPSPVVIQPMPESPALQLAEEDIEQTIKRPHLRPAVSSPEMVESEEAATVMRRPPPSATLEGGVGADTSDEEQVDALTGVRRRRRVMVAVACVVVAASVAGGFAIVSQGGGAGDTSGPPQPTDAWSIAYGIRICDEWLPSLKGTANQLGMDASTGDPSIVATKPDADGVIHYHPQVGGATGDAAVLGVFLDIYGVKLLPASLELPAEYGGRSVFNTASFRCDGEPTKLSVRVWRDYSLDTFTDIRANLNDVRLTNNGMAIAIAIVSAQDDVPKPPSVAVLPDLGVVGSG